jgi:hypothetical protein
MLDINPRFSLPDLPRDIQDAVPPLTKKEKRAASLFAVPFFVMVLAIPFMSTLALNGQNAGNVAFCLLFLNAYGILLAANVAELILVDLLLICTITPKFVVIPGTEGLAGYRDYAHQIKAHLRGSVLMAVLALIIAAMVSFLR